MLMQAMEQLRQAARSERGEVTIEWGVLVVFIALALITVVGIIVTGISDWFTAISDFVGSTTPAAGGGGTP